MEGRVRRLRVRRRWRWSVSTQVGVADRGLDTIIFPGAHAKRSQCSFHEIRGHFVAEESQISKAPLQNDLISP